MSYKKLKRVSLIGLTMLQLVIFQCKYLNIQSNLMLVNFISTSKGYFRDAKYTVKIKKIVILYTFS